MEAPPGYAIRPASRRDRDVLAEMFRSFLEEQAEWGGMFGVAAGPHPEYEALFDRLLAGASGEERPLVLMATTGTGSPVGFLMASLATRPAFFDERRRGRIDDAWVRPEHRRAGLGRALVEAALSWLRERGGRRVILQVARRNEGGARFWRALGFAPFMDVLERDL